jgi:hypothetical protein
LVEAMAQVTERNLGVSLSEEARRELRSNAMNFMISFLMYLVSQEKVVLT